MKIELQAACDPLHFYKLSELKSSQVLENNSERQCPNTIDTVRALC